MKYITYTLTVFIGMCLMVLTVYGANYIFCIYLDDIITSKKVPITNLKLIDAYNDKPNRKFTFTIYNMYLPNDLDDTDFEIICSLLDTDCLESIQKMYDTNKVKLYKIKGNDQYLSVTYPDYGFIKDYKLIILYYSLHIIVGVIIASIACFIIVTLDKIDMHRRLNY